MLFAAAFNRSVSWQSIDKPFEISNFSKNQQCNDQPVNSFLSQGAWSATHYSSSSQSSTATSFLNPPREHLTFLSSSSSLKKGIEPISWPDLHNPITEQFLIQNDSFNHPRIKLTKISNAIASLTTFNSLESTESITSNFSFTTKDESIVSVDFLFAPSLISDPISLLYTNDNRFVWGSSFTTTFKIDRSKPSLRLVDAINHKTLPSSFSEDDQQKDVFHGAYSLLSNEVCY